jgi:cytoskeleton protein RodZ
MRVESFGARLKREREQRRITLDDIALSTKIGARFLAALEEEQFDRLPGGIFNKSFVRAYARYLGIDETQAVADYVAASAETLPESRPEETIDLAAMAAQSKKTDRSTGGIPWGAFALALLIVAFSFAVWGFYSREKTARPARAPSSLPKASAPAPANVTPDAPSKLSPPEMVSASSQPAAGLSDAGPAPEPAAPVSAPPQSASPQSAAPEPGTPGSTTSVPAVAAAAAPPVPGSIPGSFLVQVKAREDSWVSIVADGKPVMEQILSASAEKSIEAHSQVILKTGNVGALDILFNGKQLPPQGNFSQVKTLTFDSNGLHPGSTRPQ